MPGRVRLPNPLAALDDRALVARFTEERDQSAFEQLVKRHGGLVFGVCRRAVRDAHLAEDAYQAVFLVLARNPRGALESASVGGWLFGVARRVGQAARRHELRRERRSGRAGGVSPLLERHDAPPQTDFDDLLRVLDEELAALPEELRAALVACFLEERTQDEAARELGWSLSTLRRRLDRGKELLRARLSRRGVALAVGLFAGGMAAPARAAVPALAPPSPVSHALAAEAVRTGVAKLAAALTMTLAVALGGLAFGLSRDPAEPPAPVAARFDTLPAPVPAPAVAPAPRPVGAHKWVTVSGRLVFQDDRKPPKPEPVPAWMIKDADMWKPFGPLTFAKVTINPTNRGVADAIVFLRPDSDDRKAEFPADRVHPDLARAKPTDRPVVAAGPHFAPRVLAVRAGDRLVFENRLPARIVVGYTAAGEEPNGAGHKLKFNVMIGANDKYASEPLPAMQRVDQFSNSVHHWMDGFVWAFDHPYFAVTDADGRFELPNVPVGTWRLVTWHQVVGWGPPGRLGTKITVPGTRAARELDPMTFGRDYWPE